MEDTIMKMFIVTGGELCELKIEAEGESFLVSILGGSDGDFSSCMTKDELKEMFSTIGNKAA